MKKLITLFTAAVLLAALSACGSKTNTAAPTSPVTSTAPAVSGEAQKVTLVASNFQYDKAEYKVKAGQPVILTLESKEGMHGARISAFNVNLNKNDNTATFTPDKAGTYDIICSVPCGSGHTNMKSKLIVE